METVVINPYRVKRKFKKKKEWDFDFMKKDFKKEKVKKEINKKEDKKKGGNIMKKKKTVKKMVLKRTKNKIKKSVPKKIKSLIKIKGERTRPVFYKINKNTIRRSPMARKKYEKVINPMKFITSSLNDIKEALPDVLYASAGYIGIGYVERFIQSKVSMLPMDNALIRQLTKVGLTIGLSSLAGMWNKKASKMVFLGGLLNIGQDIWTSYELNKLIPIQIEGNLTAGSSQSSQTSQSSKSSQTDEDEGTSSLISTSEIDSLITNNETLF